MTSFPAGARDEERDCAAAGGILNPTIPLCAPSPFFRRSLVAPGAAPALLFSVRRPAARQNIKAGEQRGCLRQVVQIFPFSIFRQEPGKGAIPAIAVVRGWLSDLKRYRMAQGGWKLPLGTENRSLAPTGPGGCTQSEVQSGRATPRIWSMAVGPK